MYQVLQWKLNEFSAHLEDPVYICGGQTATLSCNSTSVIELETAEYGTYSTNCATCCNPEIVDCTQNMAQTNFDEWQILNVCHDVIKSDRYYTGPSHVIGLFL